MLIGKFANDKIRVNFRKMLNIFISFDYFPLPMNIKFIKLPKYAQNNFVSVETSSVCCLLPHHSSYVRSLMCHNGAGVISLFSVSGEPHVIVFCLIGNDAFRLVANEAFQCGREIIKFICALSFIAETTNIIETAMLKNNDFILFTGICSVVASSVIKFL